MMRSVAAGVALSVFGAGAAIAPFQCGSHNQDPSLRQEDTAGDALYDLAQQFRSNHDDAAARQTLAYLVQKYPSSRHVVEASEELTALAGPMGKSSPPSADAGS